MPKIYTIMFSFSLVFIAASVVLLALYGLNFGVDFKGGSVLELQFAKERPSIDALQQSLASVAKDASVSPSGDADVIVRTSELNETDHQKVLKAITDAFPASGVQEVKFDSVGPVIGQELKGKSLRAIIYVLLA